MYLIQRKDRLFLAYSKITQKWYWNGTADEAYRFNTKKEAEQKAQNYPNAEVKYIRFV